MENSQAMVKRWAKYRAGALGLVAVLAVFFAASTPARAAFIYNIFEVGSDVHMNGQGSINIIALTTTGSTTPQASMASGFGFVLGGNEGDGGVAIMLEGLTGGPISFGSNTFFTAATASESSGVLLGIAPTVGRLYVPMAYWPTPLGPGPVISNSTIWKNQSLSSLGLTQGTTAEWTWGSGMTADSLILNVIPEPSSGGLVVLAGGVLLGWRRVVRARRSFRFF